MGEWTGRKDKKNEKARQKTKNKIGVCAKISNRCVFRSQTRILI